jgi:hypothetical protein
MLTNRNTEMKTHRELQQLGLDSFTMSRFTGTSAYYRISRRHLLTDGTKHLAEKAACFWMMDAIASHLCEIGTEDWFVVVHVKVTEGRAVMIYEDGNDMNTPDKRSPTQTFPWTPSRSTPAGIKRTG